ncbi:fimbria/pilus periplasmic chaperone, partial [Pseudomonas aeruginosa]
QGLPTECETYMLLSVLAVPHETGKGAALPIALRHRFKLFYRPYLKATGEHAMAGLTWFYDPECSPRTRNPSPYYVTLSKVEFLDAPRRLCTPTIEHQMLATYTENSIDSIDCQAIKARYEVVSHAGNLQTSKFILPTNGKATANKL